MSAEKRLHEPMIATIRRYQMLAAGDLIVVAVSGGLDSVALLYALHQLRQRFDLRLHVAHLNHQFRGAEAVRDAEFVRQLADRLGVPCTLATRDVPAVIRERKLSPQDAARQVRYEFLRALAVELSAQKIATAHHADDQAETVLLALLRGAGGHGLGGIQPVLDGVIIRPFLMTPRADIAAFASALNIQYVTDSSNHSRKYLRNAVRLDLLPLLQAEFCPAIVKRLTTYAELFQQDALFIDKIARARYHAICADAAGAVRFELARFAAEDATMQRACVYLAYQALTGRRYDLATARAQAIIDLFTRQAAGKRIALPHNISARRTAQWGLLENRASTATASSGETAPCQLAVPGGTDFGEYRLDADIFATTTPEIVLREAHQCATAAQVYLDYDQIAFPVALRLRLPGDEFQPLGMQGKKRVKKFFIDRKVPRDQRHSIPLCVDQRGIIWVTGWSLADRIKITPHTRKILALRVSARAG